MRNNTIYWKRLNLCAELIRSHGELTRLELARLLNDKGLPTTPWTIDKIKPDLMEMFDDIRYNKSHKKFFIKTEFSFSSLSLLKKKRN